MNLSNRQLTRSLLSGLLIFVGVNPAAAQTAGTSAPVTILCNETPDLSGVWEVSEFKLTANQVEKTYKVVLDSYGNGTYETGSGLIATMGLSAADWTAVWQRPDIDQDGGFVLRFSRNYEEAVGSWWPTRIGKKNYAPRWVLYRYHWKRLTHARAGATAPRFPDVAQLKTKLQVSADINAMAAALNDRGSVVPPAAVVSPIAVLPAVSAPQVQKLTGCPVLFNADLANVSDPLRPVNKFIFDGVTYAGEHSVNPLIRGFGVITPDFVKTGFTNFFDHYRLTMSVPNSLLQLQLRKTAHELGRLALNSTTAGFYDLAANLPGDLKLRKLRAETLGLTFGHWINAAGGGYWEGPILFPLRFQHTRDLIATIAESNVNPINKMIIGAVQGLVNPQSFVVQYVTDNAPFMALGLMGNDSENQKKSFYEGPRNYDKSRDSYLNMDRSRLMPEKIN